MAPIALRVEIAEIELVLAAELDRRRGAGDLARDEGFAAQRALVVEEYPVGRVDAVRLAIIDDDPIGVEFGRRIGRARVEWGCFRLRRLCTRPYSSEVEA